MLPLFVKLLPTAQLGFKWLKYFVDNAFRDKVIPVPGSVVYCDLWLAVEHSGIYLDDGQISNIVVDGLTESSVTLSKPESFTSKSMLGRKIYVSCDADGAVGHHAVSQRAAHHVGVRSFYGLVIKNCHQFSTKCVNHVGPVVSAPSLWERALSMLPGETWEPTMATLKKAAHHKLGATKWRLWDWQNGEEEETPEPDWEAHNERTKNMPLTEESIAQLRADLAAAVEYEAEIADEGIPDYVRQHLDTYRRTLSDISAKYEEAKVFLTSYPGARFSYADLLACIDDFSELAAQLQSNAAIRELARKIGRNYISEEKKKQACIPLASKSEVHGTHRSDDVMRILPSELLNLEDENLEMLFYAGLLEKNLISYELSGTTLVTSETTEIHSKRTGPVVACLDTSASMQGAPLLKAKALLLAIASLLKQEDRSLHVLLFGSAGEIREFSMDGHNDAAELLKFVQNGFGGGTDFQTPLKRALQIIGQEKDFLKADVLMLSDGDCSLSPEFAQQLRDQTRHLECNIYSVLCTGSRVKDTFSDEVVVL